MYLMRDSTFMDTTRKCSNEPSKLGILQSNYIPWKGYFDIIHDVDRFIFYDDVLYTHRDWRNRNQIITKKGSKWLSIPVGKHENKLVCEIEIKDDLWQKEHWDSIRESYNKAPCFKSYKDFFEEVYLGKKWDSLYLLNRFLIKHISREFLGINTIFDDSRDYPTKGIKHEKLFGIVSAVKPDIYITGPLAKNYIIQEDFQKNDIQIVWKDYRGYPEYKQVFGGFNHNVSIIDLLFNTGQDAPYYIWGWRQDPK